MTSTRIDQIDHVKDLKTMKETEHQPSRGDSVSIRNGNEQPAILQITDDKSDNEQPAVDLFQPFPVDPVVSGLEDEENILRTRSIVTGIILGGVVNAANLYLGLKTGLTFVATLFGSLMGFAIMKSISTALPKDFPILGGGFGPKENVILQTSATAAGGLSNIFVSAVPAMYQMGLFNDPVGDYGKIVTITLGVAYVGFFFATPLRNLFIVQLARQLNLVFPTSTATAATIRTLHTDGTTGSTDRKKVKILMYAFGAAFILRVVSTFAIGILWDWHIFTWFFIWGNYKNSAILVENWGWFIEWTPAVMGTGMMVGTNTALSIFAGAVVSWGIIGPILVRYGAASGVLLMGEGNDGPWKDWTTYASMSLEDPVNDPSPRYWLLWPGVLLMIVVAIVEVLCQYQILTNSWAALKEGLGSAAWFLFTRLNGKPPSWLDRHGREDLLYAVPDRQSVRTWMWSLGLVISTVVTCVSAALQWGTPIGITIVSIVLAVLFTLIAVLSTGMTDMTPLTAVSKSSQLILGGITRNGNYDLSTVETINSVGGIIAAGIASQATDLTQDFRVGYLLSVSPRTQWFAQGIASMAAIFLAPGLFVVFAKAYPCILDVSATKCAFSVPSASAWRAATIAATSPTLPVPLSSGIFAVILSCVASATVVLKHFYLTGRREKYRTYLPNWLGFGIMMVIPSPSIGVAIMIGAIASLAWQRIGPLSHEMYIFPVIAGMISGEGIGGILNAILAIAGVSAGTNIACPGDSC